MKVVHIITGLTAGGAETALLKLVSSLRGEVEHEVVSLGDEGIFAEPIRAVGVPVHCLGMRAARPSPAHFIALVRLLRKLRPDVVQTWMYHADLIGGLAARAARVPAVVWGIRHGNLDPSLNKRTTLLVARACALLSRRVPDVVLSVSKAAAHTHAGFGYDAQRIEVIPNGIDTEGFRFDADARSRLRAQWQWPESASNDDMPLPRPVIALLARWDPHKDHRCFIEAAAKLHSFAPNVRYVLAGDGIGPENASLCGLLREHGLAFDDTAAAPVRLIGPRNDMSAVLSAIDLLVSSSLGEAFPNVLAEAMSCERPCVVTDVGESADIVDRFGQVVAPGDPNALATAVAALLGESAAALRTLGAQARESIRHRFAIEQVAARHDALYRRILATRTG